MTLEQNTPPGVEAGGESSQHSVDAEIETSPFQSSDTQTGRFLRALHGDRHDPNHVVCLDVQDAGGRNWRTLDRYECTQRDLARLVADVTLEETRSAFITVCPRHNTPFQGHGKKELVRLVPGLWCDVDTKHLPEDFDALEAIKSSDLQPSMVVATGHGWHVYLLFTSPYRIEKDRDVRDLENLNRRFAATVARLLGAPVDPVQDLSRMVRVPGSVNWKDADDPVPVELLWDDGPRYGQEVEQLLDGAPARPDESSPVDLATLSASVSTFDVDRKVSEAVNRALRARGANGRNNFGYWLAQRCREYGLPKEEAREAMRKYHESVRGEGDHEYEWAEAEKSLESAYEGFTASERNAIVVRPGHLPDAAAAAWNALLDHNGRHRIFRRDSELVQIVESGDGEAAHAIKVNADGLRHVLNRSAIWLKDTHTGPVSTDVAEAVVRDMHAQQHPPKPMPPLDRVVTAPVYGADGELLVTPGYHPGSRTFFAPAPGLVIPEVALPQSVEARSDAVAESVDWLCNELLVDFPFATNADRAHALGLLLLLFVRDMIDGPTPLHLFFKTVPGVGASLLVETLAYPAVGMQYASVSGRDGGEEMRKTVTTVLTEAPTLVVFDNVTEIDSPPLAKAMTDQKWSDRRLGYNDQQLTLDVRCAWAATGNNVQLSSEIGRRTLLIELVPDVEHPESKPLSAFKHPDHRRWMREERATTLRHVYVLVENWKAEGCPRFTDRSLGSFEECTAVVGGILQAAGASAFLTQQDRVFDLVKDQRADDWRTRFVLTWWQTLGAEEVFIGQLVPAAREEGLPLPSEYESEAVVNRKLGDLLKDPQLQRGRFFMLDGSRLHVEKRGSNPVRWRLVRTERRGGDPGIQ